MYQHILIPIDGSDLSIGGVRHGVEYAKGTGARITILTVTPPLNVLELGNILPPRNPEEYRKAAEEQAATRFLMAEEIAKPASVPYKMVHVEHARPYEAILETAASRGCDLIVMASHGRDGLSALLLGSETMKVLMHSTILVLVIR